MVQTRLQKQVVLAAQEAAHRRQTVRPGGLEPLLPVLELPKVQQPEPPRE
jgi:hypothetical protein